MHCSLDSLVSPPHNFFEQIYVDSLKQFDVPASNLRNTLSSATNSEEPLIYFHTGNHSTIPEIKFSSKCTLAATETKLAGHLFSSSKDGRILVVCNDRIIQIFEVTYPTEAT